MKTRFLTDQKKVKDEISKLTTDNSKKKKKLLKELINDMKVIKGKKKTYFLERIVIGKTIAGVKKVKSLINN